MAVMDSRGQIVTGRMDVCSTAPPCREGSVQVELGLLSDRVSHIGEAIHELRNKLSGVLRSTPSDAVKAATNGHSPNQSKLAADLHGVSNLIEGFRDNIVDMIETLDLS